MPTRDVPFSVRWIISHEKEREGIKLLQKRLGTDLPIVIERACKPEKRPTIKRNARRYRPEIAKRSRPA